MAAINSKLWLLIQEYIYIHKRLNESDVNAMAKFISFTYTSFIFLQKVKNPNSRF
jgi:hypothetical protein